MKRRVKAPTAQRPTSRPRALPATTQDRSLTIRLPAAMLERAEALIPALTADPAVTAARGGSAVGLSAVVRLALLEGLGVLEGRCATR